MSEERTSWWQVTRNGEPWACLLLRGADPRDLAVFVMEAVGWAGGEWYRAGNGCWCLRLCDARYLFRRLTWRARRAGGQGGAA